MYKPEYKPKYAKILTYTVAAILYANTALGVGGPGIVKIKNEYKPPKPIGFKIVLPDEQNNGLEKILRE